MNYNDQNTEKAILGQLILEGNSIAKIPELKPDHFYDDFCKQVFTAITTLFETGKTIDYLQVFNEVRKINEKITPYEITILSQNVGSARNIEFHAKIIIELSVKRDLHKAAALIQSKLEKSEDLQDIINFNFAELLKITKIVEKRKTVHISESLAEIKEEQIAFQLGEENEIIKTKYQNIDSLLKIQAPDFVVLAARPGKGKTALAVNITTNLCKQGKKVLFFSLEMSTKQITKRILSSEMQINSQLLNSAIPDDYANKFDYFQNEISQYNLFVDDTAGLNILQLRSKITEQSIDRKIDFIVIDYLQLMQGLQRANRNRENEVSEISRQLKEIAKDFDCPILALAQLNREIEKRADQTPKLSDLRESGSIEQDADIVLFLNSVEANEDGEPVSENIIQFVCAKYRNGSTFDTELLFEKKYLKFYDYNGNINVSDEIVPF